MSFFTPYFSIQTNLSSYLSFFSCPGQITPLYVFSHDIASCFSIYVTYTFTIASTCTSSLIKPSSVYTNLYSSSTISSAIAFYCDSLSSLSQSFSVKIFISFAIIFSLISLSPLLVLVIVLILLCRGVKRARLGGVGGGGSDRSSGRTQLSLVSFINFNHFTSCFYMLLDSVMWILIGVVVVGLFIR